MIRLIVFVVVAMAADKRTLSMQPGASSKPEKSSFDNPQNSVFYLSVLEALGPEAQKRVKKAAKFGKAGGTGYFFMK